VVKPGTTEGRIVSNLDFAPTFLEAAGIEIPAEIQGRSLVPILRGEAPKDWRKSFYYQYFEYPQPHHVRPHHGVVTDRYKLIRFDGPDLDAWELFDLQEDPRELRDVYDDPARRPVVDELKRELERLRGELKVPDSFPSKVYGNAPLPKASP
jgi:arylsulfatase A-like enzyme